LLPLLSFSVKVTVPPRARCDYCVHATTHDVDPMTQYGMLEDNVAAMGSFDWLALLFAAFVVGFQVAAKQREAMSVFTPPLLFFMEDHEWNTQRARPSVCFLWRRNTNGIHGGRV
jgi:hypothetical protein